jgi:hypothetical protein
MEDSKISTDFVSNLESGILPSLADLLVRYNLTSHFNIFLPHRHFDLANDERFVRLHTDTGTTVFSIFTDNAPDPTIVDNYNLSVPDAPAVVPFSFLVADTFVPFEYECVDRESAQGFHLKDVAPEFFTAWAAILHDHSVECPLGLTSRSDAGTIRRCDAARRVDVETQAEGSDPPAFPAEWSVEPGSSGTDHRIVVAKGCGN